MTSGPRARVYQILEVPFGRPRDRVEVLEHPDYYAAEGRIDLIPRKRRLERRDRRCRLSHYPLEAELVRSSFCAKSHPDSALSFGGRILTNRSSTKGVAKSFTMRLLLILLGLTGFSLTASAKEADAEAKQPDSPSRSEFSWRFLVERSFWMSICAGSTRKSICSSTRTPRQYELGSVSKRSRSSDSQD